MLKQLQCPKFGNYLLSFLRACVLTMYRFMGVLVRSILSYCTVIIVFAPLSGGWLGCGFLFFVAPGFEINLNFFSQAKDL